MIKKIPIERLKPGMFVHDFNCGWLDHPFLKNSVLITNESMIRKVIEVGIREVYVDVSKGINPGDAPQKEEVSKRNLEAVKKIVEKHPEVENSVPMMEELAKAIEVQKEAKKVITGVMEDIHSGKEIEREKVDQVVEEMVDSVIRNKHALTSLSRVKKKDQYTYLHSVNVSILMISFCRTMKMSREDIAIYGAGALLHDIGKMKVSQELLNKPSKLTDDEFAQMKMHAVYSGELLTETGGFSQKAIDVASQHHERFDGTGYPKKLKGSEISQGGQMSAIVDVYDAITSDRCYHEGMDPVEALKKIFEWSKFHFDPKLVQYYIRSVGIYPIGTLVRLESDHLAVVLQPGEEDLTKPKVKVIYDAERDWPVEPRNLDLAKSLGGVSSQDRIVSTESPLKWKINPLKYIDYLNPE